MFETQCAAQLDETKAAQKALSEATTEIEVSESIQYVRPNMHFPLITIVYILGMCSCLGCKYGIDFGHVDLKYGIVFAPLS